MEIENQENGQESQENQQVPENESSANSKSDVLNSLQGFLSEKELNEIRNVRKSNEPENTSAEEESVEIEAESEKDLEEQKETSVDTQKKNVLGITNKKQEKKSDFVIENEAHILDVVKTKFGQDVKEVKDLPKFFEAAQKWRADSQKVEEVSTKYQQLEDLVSGLPEELISSMQMFYEGKDYSKAFEDKSKINYSTDFESQDLKSIVNEYFPNKFSDEDFEEEEKSQALEIAIAASEDKFNAKKQTVESQRAKIAEDAVKQNELYKSSVNGSVKNLMQSFPDTDKNEIKNIQKTLEGGTNAIVSLFLNNDGSVKESAAESLMLALHGKSVIESMMEVAAHQTETKVAEDLLSRGNDTRKVKGVQGTEILSEEAKRVLADLQKFEKKPTF